MLKHIVMLRLKENAEGADKAANAQKLKELLEGLTGKIEELIKLEVGINIVADDQAADLVLCTEFQSVGGLKRYAVHPEHLKVVEFIKRVVEERRVVDYHI